MKEKRGAPRGNNNALGNSGGRKPLKVEKDLLNGLTELNPLIIKKIEELIKSKNLNVALKAIQVVIDKQLVDKHENELSNDFNYDEIDKQAILAEVKYLLLKGENKRKV